MSSPQGSGYRLTFIVPRSEPPIAGACAVRLGAAVHAEVVGPSREAVMTTAAAFLRSLGPGEPRTLHAVLESPAGAPSGRDGWSVIVGADVAFAATSIDPFLPARA